MKKAAAAVFLLAAAVLFVDLALMGGKLLSGDYAITAEAWVAAAALAALLLCALYKLWSRPRCPHCGKHTLPGGEYCPYCGKKLGD